MADEKKGRVCGSVVKRVLAAVLTLVTVAHCPRWNQSIWKAPVRSWELSAEPHSQSKLLVLEDAKENESGPDSNDYSAGGNVDQMLLTLTTRQPTIIPVRPHSTFADDAIALDAFAHIDEPFVKTHQLSPRISAEAVVNANTNHLQEFASR